MKGKISLITLGVKDFQKSLKFYRNGLGFKPNNYKDSDGFVMFEMEGTWLSLYPEDKLAEDAGVKFGTGFSGVTLSHNVRTKDEVNQVEVAFNPVTDLT